DAREIQKSVAGDVYERSDGDSLRVQKVHDRPHVDVGRPQQLFTDRGAEPGHVLIRLESADLEQRLPCQREAVTVNSAAPHGDDDVARCDLPRDDDAVDRNDACAHPDEVQASAWRLPSDDVGKLRDLSADDADAGQLGAGIEPLGDLLEYLGGGA